MHGDFTCSAARDIPGGRQIHVVFPAIVTVLWGHDPAASADFADPNRGRALGSKSLQLRSRTTRSPGRSKRATDPCTRAQQFTRICRQQLPLSRAHLRRNCRTYGRSHECVRSNNIDTTRWEHRRMEEAEPGAVTLELSSISRGLCYPPTLVAKRLRPGRQDSDARRHRAPEVHSSRQRIPPHTKSYQKTKFLVTELPKQALPEGGRAGKPPRETLGVCRNASVGDRNVFFRGRAAECALAGLSPEQASRLSCFVRLLAERLGAPVSKLATSSRIPKRYLDSYKEDADILSRQHFSSPHCNPKILGHCFLPPRRETGRYPRRVSMQEQEPRRQLVHVRP